LLGIIFRASEDYFLNNRKESGALILFYDFCIFYASKYSEWPIEICGNIACKLTMDYEWSLINCLINMRLNYEIIILEMQLLGYLLASM
jgi:hypothetical protein